MASADTTGRDIGLIGVAASGPSVLALTTAGTIITYYEFAALFIAGPGWP